MKVSKMQGMEKQPFVSCDYKEIAVESARLSQYLDAYACFGWQTDREMGDVAGRTRLSLKRDRHILNKTELTRLERQFEACMDSIRALQASIHSRATMASLVVALLGTAFMAGATFAVTAEPPIVWLCVLLAVPGFTGWACAYFVYRRVFKLRAQRVEPLIEGKRDEIEETCKKGARLLGV